jgi:amino acid adenylation domain-containing protein
MPLESRQTASAVGSPRGAPTAAGIPAAAALEAALAAAAARVLGTSAAIDARLPLTGLGLDSLAAIELQQAIELEHGVAPSLADLLDGASIADLARRLLPALTASGVEPAARPRPAAAAAEEPAATSHGQRVSWLLHRVSAGSAAYHLAGVARARPARWTEGAAGDAGPIDVAALRAACRVLVARHAALRTTFEAPTGVPLQRERPAGGEEQLDFVAEEVSGLDAASLAARVALEVRRPFDLERGPLLRVAALSPGAGEDCLLVLAMPHIAGDFWSMSILARELGVLYASARRAAAAAALVEAAVQTPRPEDSLQKVLPPPAAEYRDYVAWCEDRLAGSAGERLWSYWQGALQDAPPALDLPTDRPRPPVQTYVGRGEVVRLPEALGARLRAVAAAHSTTLFTVALTAWKACLVRLAGQPDVVVGSPVALRGSASFAGVVGYCINQLPLRTRLAGDPRLGEALARVRRTVLDGLAHAEYPFGLLAERLQPKRDPSRTPLYQVLFGLHRAERLEEQGLAAFALGVEGVRVRLGGLELQSVAVDSGAAQMDLTLYVAELPGALAAALRYNSDLFDAATAQRMLGYFGRLLEGVCSAGDPHLSALPMLSAAERAQLLWEWSSSPWPPAGGACLPQLFEAQALRAPAAPALIDGAVRLSYGELNRRANRLAHALRAEGVAPEVRVGLCLRRSADMVVALLAVLKAGGAYVPLDPAYPGERLAFMLLDSRCALLLSDDGAPDFQVPPGLPVRALSHWPPPRHGEAPAGRAAQVASSASLASSASVASAAELDPAPRAVPGNLAYVMYTSGSTGLPKGVAIEHRSVADLVLWAGAAFAPAELAGVLASTSICFDLSVFELLATLALGGAVVLAADVLRLPDLPEAAAVTLVNTVPSAIAELAGRLPPRAATVTLCGEPLKAAVVERIYGQETVTAVINLYGPTEATVYSTVAPVARGAGGEPAIGRPLAANRVLVLDAWLEPVPCGAAGELFLGGNSLARCYLDRPAMTAERFLPDPFSGVPGGRIYRTGDMVRFRRDGALDHLGRADGQVKIRGFRVELGEVEAVLAQHPRVRAAAVAVHGAHDGARRLVAYLVAAADASPAPAAEMRAFAATRLPAHMLPASFTWLPALPSTPNGKLDRRALPAPAEPVGDAAAPRHPVEELVAIAWAQVLGLSDAARLRPDQDFFSLGGHSLLASRLQERIRRTFGVDLPLGSLFELTTVARQARRIERELAGAPLAERPPLRAAAPAGPLPLSPSQERLWRLQSLDAASPALNVPAAVGLAGRLDVAALALALSELVRRHEPLRTAFLATAAGPRQEVTAAAAQALPVVDLGALPATAREQERRRLVAAEGGRGFDLAHGRPLRTLLLRLAAERHALALTVHHLACDGQSLAILNREIGALYGAYAGRRRPDLPAPRLRYADWSCWQRARGEHAAAAGELAYWRRQLAALPPPMALPGQRRRGGLARLRGAVERFAVPAPVAAAIADLAHAEGCTRFIVLVAALQLLLLRYTGSEDLIVGTNVAGRDAEEVEDLIGCFINTVALRCDLAGDPGLREAARRVRAVALAAYTHQSVPFERVAAELAPDRVDPAAPIFQAMLVWQSFTPADWRLPPLRTFPVEVEHGGGSFGLTWMMGEAGDALAGALVYDRDLFPREAAVRLATDFAALLAAAAVGPDLAVSALAGAGALAAAGAAAEAAAAERLANAFNEDLRA